MVFTPKLFRRSSRALPIGARSHEDMVHIRIAIEHLEQHGNLDSFPGSRNRRLALMKIVMKQGLVAWDRSRKLYELTSLGKQRLSA
jgi:hypothetical protein